jgi:hypothetical protein
LGVLRAATSLQDRRLWQGAIDCVTIGARPRTGYAEEESMAKSQLRGNKEAKKPKADKPKSSVSEYKKSQGATGQAMNPPGKKS